MASRFIYLQGKSKWSKFTTPDTRYGNAWKTMLYPTPDSLKIIEGLKSEGLLNKVSMDEDGKYIQLKRPTSITVNGKIQGLQPPEVLEADGKTPLRNALVGNGSDLTCKMVVYNYHKAGDAPGTKKGLAMRLESVRVDHLVPFEMQRDFDQGQQDMARGLSEAPPQPMF